MESDSIRNNGSKLLMLGANSVDAADVDEFCSGDEISEYTTIHF